MAAVPMPMDGVVVRSAPPSLYTPIVLPSHLRGYVKYVVVLNPVDCKTYSLGIKYVCQTEGAKEVLQRLSDKRDRRHRKPLHSGLCLSSLQGVVCPIGFSCAAIHCTREGLVAMRPWSQMPPDKAPAPSPAKPIERRRGSPSPNSSLGDHSSRSASILSDEFQNDAATPSKGPMVTPPRPLWVGAVEDTPTGLSSAVIPSPQDSPVVPPLRLQFGKSALRQSLARLRQRVQKFEATPRLHQWEPAGACIVEHLCSFYHPGHPDPPLGSAGAPTHNKTVAE